ncbi:MAG: hypothetical protein WA364_18830 [Candidatus Nitrosopolaris sp.]
MSKNINQQPPATYHSQRPLGVETYIACKYLFTLFTNYPDFYIFPRIQVQSSH